MFHYLDIFSMHIDLYEFFGNLAAVVLVLFNFMVLRKEGEAAGIYSRLFLNRKASFAKFTIFFIFVEALILSAFQYVIPTLAVSHPFARLITKSAGNYCGCSYIFPLFFIVGALIVGAKPLKELDLLTPAYPLALVYSKLGCFCAGCCRGIRTDFGFYNQISRMREFPVQLLEAVLALAIFFVLMRIKDKVKRGTMYPIYLILYSGTRFFSEFLRVELNKYGPLKTYHILCIIGVVLGFIELWITRKWGERIDDAFGRLYSKIEQKFQK